jgi:hypothetical protein
MGQRERRTIPKIEKLKLKRAFIMAGISAREEKMRRINEPKKRENPFRIIPACLVCIFILLTGTSSGLYATQSAERNFPSPDEAVKSLVVAVRAHDLKELLAILGPEGRELISSGDEASDRMGR